MSRWYPTFILLGLTACGSGVAAPPPARCGPSLEGPPSPITVPHDGDNGIFDASLEHDPATGRVWMSLSSVRGPAGTGYVSTDLAYSDDRGATWCRVGTVNAATEVRAGDLPTELRGLPSHRNHEVYRGCWFFQMDPTTGAVRGDAQGRPTTVIPHREGTILSGMCTFHEAAVATGIIYGEAHVDEPQFRLFATGTAPSAP